MEDFRLSKFIEQIKDESPDEMLREVTRWSNRAREIARTYHTSDRDRTEKAKDIDRQLGGVGFFLHHCAKADGLTDFEFHLLQPIADSLVSRNIWRPEVLKQFV